LGKRGYGCLCFLVVGGWSFELFVCVFACLLVVLDECGRVGK